MDIGQAVLTLHSSSESVALQLNGVTVKSVRLLSFEKLAPAKSKDVKVDIYKSATGLDRV